MPDSRLTPLQRKALELILGKAQYYIDTRQQAVIRVNPKIELVWDDVVWQQMANLRRSISADKAYGPIRFQVAETMIGDDEKRIYDLFALKSQYCLLGEIVEEKEADTARTRGILEIHDMRTLFRAIDPTIESLVSLVQTFIWWDVEDCQLLSKFDWKAAMLSEIASTELSDEVLAGYQERMGSEVKPGKDQIIEYELKQMAKVVAAFRQRRHDDHGHHVIIRREVTQIEDPDVLIEATASQSALVASLEKGGTLDEALIERLAKAMHCAPGEVSPEKAKTFLKGTIQANKKRLRKALSGMGSGEPYSVKDRQMQELEKRFNELKGDHEIQV